MACEETAGPVQHDSPGWDSAFDSVTADITVTALYEINTYTVTFVANGGGVITGGNDVQTVEYGSAAVEPVITEAPLMVPVVIAALVKVLFDRVSASSRITITPLAGNVAVELMPVPPFDLPSNPATAEDEARLRLPNSGPAAPTVNT